MGLAIMGQRSSGQACFDDGSSACAGERKWFAVFTVPQNEKSVVKHLDIRDVEAFLPTYETVRVWKNRQRVKTVLPLFPTYLFVRINLRERVRVLESPGVLQIVGNGRHSASLQESEIALLRSGLGGQQVEPYHELVVGEKVRIKSGVMRGMEGTLVRKNSRARFVLTLGLINQHAAVEVDPELLEPLFNETPVSAIRGLRSTI
jgi:transcription antitermination factor NusG